MEFTTDAIRNVLEAAPDAMMVVSRDGTILQLNAQAERTFGAARALLLGTSVDALVPSHAQTKHTAHRAAFWATPRTRAMGAGGELSARRHDGSELPVEISLSPTQIDGKDVVIVAIRDVTERKRAERILKQTEDQLRQAQKMEAIGRLAGGVAHDFNNLLSVILSYASLALDRMKPGDELRGDIEEVRRAGERASELVKQLLAFSRKQVLQPRVVDLNDVLHGVEKMLRRLAGEDIELTVLGHENLDAVNIDPSQIEQVMMNLVANARDAMPRGGQVIIETQNVTLDAEYAEAHALVKPGAYVMLVVTDTGIGMDSTTREHLFEPFFTTKEPGQGTGLGLATVFGIVRQSGGHIWVYSEPNAGTTFKIYFPRSTEAPARGEPQVAHPSLRGKETVLLVEDNTQVSQVVTTILRRNGYHVLVAQNAGEALLTCERFAATIHLMLTDVVMPHMNGRELAERLRPLRPAMRVLFMSGYTENAIVHHGVLDGGVSFLPKPFTPHSVLAKVREVLDARVSP